MLKSFRVIANFTSFTLIKELESFSQNNKSPYSFISNDFADARLAISEITSSENVLIINNIPELFSSYFSNLKSLDSRQQLKETIEQFDYYLESVAAIAEARDVKVYLLEPLFLHQKLFPNSRQDLLYKSIYAQFHGVFSKFLYRHGFSRNVQSVLLKKSFDCVSNPDFFDERTNNVYGLPLTQKAIRQLSTEVFDYFHSQSPYFPKLIVVDCDNTLWKGIIGEGIEDESLISNTETRYYKLFQEQLKYLKSKGVLLAICSKNNESDLRAFFLSQNNFALNLNDFVLIEANWSSKVEMMNRVLTKVNVLPSSVLFIDDSDFEIANMQSLFPEITSIQVPKRIEDLPNVLPRFVSRSFEEMTREDSIRDESIRFEEMRSSLRLSTDSSSFLQSLCLELRIFEVKSNEDSSFARVLQLINKTNQFNFTTERETVHSLSRFLREHGRVFACSLKDRFSDYGIVGVLLAKYASDSKSFDIVNYLISCRALGRGVEMTFLKEVVAILEEAMPTSVSLTLKKSEKNVPAQSLFDLLGGQSVNNPFVQLTTFTQELLENSLLVRQEEIDVRKC